MPIYTAKRRRKKKSSGVLIPMDFFIGITLLTPKGADAVISGLVRKGYQVARAQPEPMGHFLTLKVSNDTSDEDDDDDDLEYGPEVLVGLQEDLKQILSEAESQFFSYVIFTGIVVATWGKGNLQLAPDLPDLPKGKTVFDHLDSEGL